MEVEKWMQREREHPSGWGTPHKEKAVWVDANVSGKVYHLERGSWAELIKLIEDFVRDFGHLSISWGDLYWG